MASGSEMAHWSDLATCRDSESDLENSTSSDSSLTAGAHGRAISQFVRVDIVV